ncbi:MAG: hypothetical protein KDD04_09790, partial [Sinomicrobium sp.]|nr:hypothetical protein [Sinomicrobium sp.]
DIQEPVQIQAPVPYEIKTYRYDKSDPGKKATFYDYAEYKTEGHDDDGFNITWEQHLLDLPNEAMALYSDWSQWDDFVLVEMDFNTEIRTYNYKKVRVDVFAGLTNEQIAEKHGKGLTWAKNYAKAVRKAMEYRRQAGRSPSRGKK